MKKILITILLSTLAIFTLHAQNTGINTKSPNSTITVNGSYAGNYKAISADATLTITDQFVNVLGSAAAVTVTLPEAVVADVAKQAFYGRVYHIKNTSAFDVTIKGNGTQLLQTTTASVANTVVLKGGQSVMVVKNSNNAAAAALWDVFYQSTATTNDNTFVVNAIKSFRAVVPATAFITNGGSRNLMNGKAENNRTTTNRQSAYELSDAGQKAKFIVINGLRMDFLQSGRDRTSTAPKFFNTTGATITYNVSSLSTNDSYIDGSNTNIAAGYYSYFIDGNDDFATIENGNIEYVNAMVTFPNGEWYNCTWHATRDATNYYLYFTAQRLN